MIKHKNNKFFKSFFFMLIFTFIISIGNGIKVYAQADNNNVLNQVRSLIQNGYVNEVPKEVLDSNNIEDMVKGLNDPYTKYFSSEDFKSFVNAINNSFCGIGIYNEENSEGIKVKSVMDSSPALEAGLKAGDIIIRVDGHSLKGLKLEESAKYLRGEEGSKVELEILRGEENLKFTIKRREIDLPTVNWKVIDDHIGYIKIISFGMETPELFSKAVNELEEKKVDKFIVDLRDNTGGYTNSAYNIAGHFIGEKTVIKMKNKAGNEYDFKGIGHGHVIDKPIIFLINDYTASASEILSAAVKDYKKAFFVGIKSFGKGVQQSTFPLEDGGVLKLTTHSFYSPKGNTIHKVGITPDFNTKDIDALAVAELLYSAKNKADNSNMIKVKINGNEFIIDLNKCRRNEYLKAFKHIIDNVDSNNIYLGSKNTWEKLDKEIFKNTMGFYFSDFKKFPTLVKSKDNTKFSIVFNKDIDKQTVNNDTIKLLQDNTFKDIDIDYKFEEGNKIILIPKEAANLNGRYYLVIQDIKSIGGKSINRKTAVEINLK
ncbi:carboxyl-terminal processing protease [Clostridium tetanomorphum]|uniref:PDZ domain-containing protein n=1 Tax=Clostridium tetanomorphum TaxID=1553 RepID=A0A923J141_CLOTT|nr:S41 family peptidase [Clostridium tetanomorphum]KAJ49758.1 carboxyl-terminal protease [Clostridium tetanomorphum DSM 665]KAJ53143.1 carboxyl-terminal protease [Clostridium tetanomorphum DSM 665]MBC2396938.1 PDZ domain-containing protein [Clostridium tetanomorphum]MBP1863095.1 carboxyl-terminal processing protease [Clostridium tetanomorphum]NRS84204.1 carboxyl-terminal processing protease [Clostridium tetanomorphum]